MLGSDGRRRTSAGAQGVKGFAHGCYSDHDMDGARISPAPVILEPWFSPRIWGTRDLRPFYGELGPQTEPVGEAWLTAAQSRVSGSGEELGAWWAREGTAWAGRGGAGEEPFPFLIKLLFPADYLSVQVHPDDAYAAAHGLGRGKTEMWYVLRADPGARLALGLREGATVAELERACRDAGGAAELLQWIEPAAGETYFVPAGTVHALGPGLVILEVQQPSDNTFRLDDYGRRDAAGRLRELHLDAGLAVAQARTAAGRVKTRADGLLAGCPYFRVRRIDVPAGRTERLPEAFRVVVAVAGEIRLVDGPDLPLGKACMLAAGRDGAIAGAGVVIEARPGAG